jgi:hypothetical protein
VALFRLNLEFDVSGSGGGVEHDLERAGGSAVGRVVEGCRDPAACLAGLFDLVLVCLAHLFHLVPDVVIHSFRLLLRAPVCKYALPQRPAPICAADLSSQDSARPSEYMRHDAEADRSLKQWRHQRYRERMRKCSAGDEDPALDGVGPGRQHSDTESACDHDRGECRPQHEGNADPVRTARSACTQEEQAAEWQQHGHDHGGRLRRHALRAGDLHSRETGSHSGRREDHHQQDHEGDRLHLVRALLLGRVAFGLGAACTSEGV